jgi:hypothetical protein
MVNDEETYSYTQQWYEDNIQERYKFIVEKKALIEKMSDKNGVSEKNGQDIENMEF